MTVAEEKDRIVLAYVSRQELEWDDHAKALTRTARALGLSTREVMEACDRAINPPDGMRP